MDHFHSFTGAPRRSWRMHNALFNPRIPILADVLAVQGQFSKGDQDREWQADAEQHFRCPGDMVTVLPGDEQSFLSNSMFKAHKHCLGAAAVGEWKVDQDSVAKTAKGMLDGFCLLTLTSEALDISPYCPTAYFALASVAPTYEEALELYSKGAALGPQVVGQEEWEKVQKEGTMWLTIGTRY